MIFIYQEIYYLFIEISFVCCFLTKKTMASNTPLPVAPSKGITPLFFKASTLASPPGGTINGLDICIALEDIAGKDTVDCVQRMGDLFRVYTKSESAREELLINGFCYNNVSVTLLGRNPFQVRDEMVRSTKLIIGGVPMSVADSEVERALLDLQVEMLSNIKYETYRNAEGKWTHFKTGRRFVYIKLPPLNLKPFVNIGLWKASLYYREQIRPQTRSPVDNTNGQVGQSTNLVSTETSTDGQSSTVTGSPSTKVDSAKEGNASFRGKPTYSLFASKSDSDKWNEAKGEGNTEPVKTKTDKTSKERRGRSPTRHRGRKGNIKDHWGALTNRSTSTKRKVGDTEALIIKNKNKLRKTDMVNNPDTLALSSPSQSFEDHGLC